MIVPQMARHTAGFHPMSYAVWYEYHAGLNPKLKTALDAYLAERNSLTDADIIALYEDARPAPRDAQGLGPRERPDCAPGRGGRRWRRPWRVKSDVRLYGDEASMAIGASCRPRLVRSSSMKWCNR